MHGAVVVATRAMRTDHYSQRRARAHPQLSRRTELAEEVVYVGEVHADQMLDVPVARLWSLAPLWSLWLFHNFNCHARAQQRVEF